MHYLGDPGHHAGWNGGDAGRVMLVLRQASTVKAAALQLYPAQSDGQLAALDSTTPAADELQVVHRAAQLPATRFTY